MADLPPEVVTPASVPVPNKADTAWLELERLRAQARQLGIEVDESWPIVELREQIDKARR